MEARVLESLKVLFAPLVSAVLVAVLTALFQNRMWKKQKATEQKISLIHEWEAFLGAVEYARIFESGNERLPEWVRQALTRQDGLLRNIGSAFSNNETVKAMEVLEKELKSLGYQDWHKRNQPALTELRRELLGRMNLEAFP